MKMVRSAFILWFASAMSLVAFIAGFNIVVDPFGYFGRNTVGYYFSSERQFKYSVIKSYDYNAIALGDSRIAYTDTGSIRQPGYKFVNGGIGGASVAEQVTLLASSRLDRLKLAIFGLHFGDLDNCSKDKEAGGIKFGSWDTLRFAASWSQFAYAIEALIARTRGLSPRYGPDGTRLVVSEHFQEAALDGKTGRYWDKIAADIPHETKDGRQYRLDAKCRQVLRKAQDLADHYGFTLIIVFLPKNSDLLRHLTWDSPQARWDARQFLDQVEKIVPQVVDLSISSFSDSRNFWLDDSTHFKPLIGARILEEALSRTFGRQANK